MKENVVQERHQKDVKELSKEDNPSEKDKQELDIKSFSKESINKHKPTKNLI